MRRRTDRSLSLGSHAAMGAIRAVGRSLQDLSFRIRGPAMRLNVKYFPAAAFAAFGLALFSIGDVAAQGPRPSAAGQPDASYESERVAFEKLPEAERKAI